MQAHVSDHKKCLDSSLFTCTHKQEQCISISSHNPLQLNQGSSTCRNSNFSICCYSKQEGIMSETEMLISKAIHALAQISAVAV